MQEKTNFKQFHNEFISVIRVNFKTIDTDNLKKKEWRKKTKASFHISFIIIISFQWF
jgi:hypothetical protein